jgi:hypothetical protein
MKPRRTFLLLIIGFAMLSVLPAQSDGTSPKNLQGAGYWQIQKGNRMADPLDYLKEGNPQTRLDEPFQSKQREGVFIVYDAHRGESLRLERKKDLILVDIHTLVDPGYKGRLIVEGDQVKSKNLTVFFGNKVTHGGRTIYDQIRVYHDANQDTFPAVVIRFFGLDRGVVYLDPLGSGHPLAVINFSSVPMKD